MNEKIVTTSFLIFFLYAAFQPHMIFGKVRIWFASLNDFYQKPLFSCSICMCSIWGSAIYWLLWGQSWQEWLITICGAAGFNTIIFLLSVRDFE
jgi:hypothetical protein